MLSADIMGASWIAFIVYWIISSIGTKKDSSRTGSAWLSVGARLVIAAAVIAALKVPFLRNLVRVSFDKLSMGHPAIRAVGAVLCIVGVGLAIWARTILGRNWSGRPSTKEGHELVTGGPYSVVRHPIYTGMLTAMLGTFFIAGLPGLLVFIAFSGVVIYRINVEERLMVQLFADKYLEYRRRTKALIPFLV